MTIGQTFQFNYTGSVQELDLTKLFETRVLRAILQVELAGASGEIDNGWAGGGGAKIIATLRIRKCPIYIYVGGRIHVSAGTWSFNGGGSGFHDSGWGLMYSGGGSTDIRLTQGLWYDQNSLESRIIVAAGGGAAALDAGRGGAGGLLTGGNGVARSWWQRTPSGGGQTAGGINGGQFGRGGAGCWYASNRLGYINKGGAGSGWYGGGVTDANGAAHSACSGAGGSSFIYGVNGYIKKKTLLVEGEEPSCSPIYSAAGVNVGHGYCKITIKDVEYYPTYYLFVRDGTILNMNNA